MARTAASVQRVSRRDFTAEMRTLMDAERAQPGYSSPTAAAAICQRLREEDPVLLASWLDSHAESIVRHALNLIDCANRTHTRRAAERSAFRSAAESFERGDDAEALASFLELRFAVKDGTRLALGEMYRPDRRFVIADYDQRASSNLMMAAFLRAVDKKAGNRRTDEVFDNQLLERLWASLAGAKATVSLPTAPAAPTRRAA